MYQKNITIRFGGPLTPGVKKLLILNGTIFLAQQILNLFLDGRIIEVLFGLSHEGFIQNFMLWQPFTYMFLHAGWFHIFFNLLGLWMFAGDLENYLGEKRFLKYYLFSGFGAGLIIASMNYYVFLKYGISSITIGASGALYAVLLGYAMLWPDREVLLYFLIPIKIKYLLLAFGLIEFFGTLSTVSGKGGNISHIGHIGGLIAGFFLMKKYMKIPLKKTKNISFFEKLKRRKRLKNKRKEIDDRIEAKKIIDELLAKIARSGMSSLTVEEKNKLEWARRHYYPGSNETVH